MKYRVSFLGDITLWQQNSIKYDSKCHFFSFTGLKFSLFKVGFVFYCYS